MTIHVVELTLIDKILVRKMAVLTRLRNQCFKIVQLWTDCMFRNSEERGHRKFQDVLNSRICPRIR